MRYTSVYFIVECKSRRVYIDRCDRRDFEISAFLPAYKNSKQKFKQNNNNFAALEMSYLKGKKGRFFTRSLPSFITILILYIPSG